MPGHLTPALRTLAHDAVVLGILRVYDSQADLIAHVAQQWQTLLPYAAPGAAFYGASPSTQDGKLHYLTGIAQPQQRPPTALADATRLTLAAGDYAVVTLPDPQHLRPTWQWLLHDWLPASGRRERNAPEFEKFTGISEDGQPIGPVEIWVPVEKTA